MTRDYEKILRVKMLLLKAESLLFETSGGIISPEEKKVLIDILDGQIRLLEHRCDKFNESR